MPRDNRSMYIVQVCFMSVVVTQSLWGGGVYGNVCCVADVVKDSVFSLGVLRFV